MHNLQICTSALLISSTFSPRHSHTDPQTPKTLEYRDDNFYSRPFFSAPNRQYLIEKQMLAILSFWFSVVFGMTSTRPHLTHPLLWVKHDAVPHGLTSSHSCPHRDRATSLVVPRLPHGTASPALSQYSSTKTRVENKPWSSFSSTALVLEMAEPTQLKFFKKKKKKSF